MFSSHSNQGLPLAMFYNKAEKPHSLSCALLTKLQLLPSGVQLLHQLCLIRAWRWAQWLERFWSNPINRASRHGQMPRGVNFNV